MSFSPANPTSEQFILTDSSGHISAQIAQVGASLRRLTIDGMDIVLPHPSHTLTPPVSGSVMVPWPGRVRDGRWSQRGETHQLEITEPASNNAAHGLLRCTAYSPVSVDIDRVTLTAPVFRQLGYPFDLSTSVTYSLTRTGLTVCHTIRNTGGGEAPVALGIDAHLFIRDVRSADLHFRSPGGTRFIADDRLLPITEVPVDLTYDLRLGREIRNLHVDAVYGKLRRDPDGLARHTLNAADGRHVTLWQDEAFNYAHVAAGRFPGQQTALAIAPMTAPADAFNSGLGLEWLPPGEQWELWWGVDIGRA